MRIPSIDQFRGFSILLKVLANFLAGIDSIPAWLHHSPDVGLTIIDLIAPLFIYAIGLTYGLSFSRRVSKNGLGYAYRSFFTRYLAIIGLGAILSASITAVDANPSGIDWGVLQAIGMAGLVTLIVIRLRSLYRWLIGFVLLGIYQFMLDRYWLEIVLRSPHGGFIGSLSWAAMLILATSLSDFFYDADRRDKYYPLIAVLLLSVGITLNFFLPITKNRVSASYVVVSLGVASLISYFFHSLSICLHLNSRFLVAWGKNPLILYMFHYVLIGLVFLPGIPFLYSEAPFWLVIVESVGLVGGVTMVAHWMERKDVVFSI
jgi:predicted acyltransferase